MLIFPPRFTAVDNFNNATSCRRFCILNCGCLMTRETLKTSPSLVLLCAPVSDECIEKILQKAEYSSVCSRALVFFLGLTSDFTTTLNESHDATRYWSPRDTLTRRDNEIMPEILLEIMPGV